MRIFALLSLAALSAHEVDATAAEEWRDLPLLNLISDTSTARRTFVGLHFPIYTGIFWMLADKQTEERTWTVMSAFSVLHVVLHLTLEDKTKGYYSNWLSRSLIWGAGAFGALDLMSK
jgi:hypothetical protein